MLRADEEQRSVWCYGVDSLYEQRKPLLLWAFGLNLTAIVCLSTAAVAAVRTSPSLSAVGWAAAATTTSINHRIEGCDDDAAATSISIQIFLGLRGYYSRCYCAGEELDDGSCRGAISGNFCSTAALTNHNTTIGKESSLCHRHQAAEEQSSFECELVTGTMAPSSSSSSSSSSSEEEATLPNYCSDCEDTSRDCVWTCLTAVAFGIFPLVLTVRRYFTTTNSDRGLRLRTLFFTGLAIFLGLHAFVRFHLECVQKMPSSFAILICSEHCNDGHPFLVPLSSSSVDFVLYTGGKLVIVAACLKVSYFTIHFVTPVVRGVKIPPSTPGERKALLSEKNKERSYY